MDKLITATLMVAAGGDLCRRNLVIYKLFLLCGLW